IKDCKARLLDFGNFFCKILEEVFIINPPVSVKMPGVVIMIGRLIIVNSCYSYKFGKIEMIIFRTQSNSSGIPYFIQNAANHFNWNTCIWRGKEGYIGERWNGRQYGG